MSVVASPVSLLEATAPPVALMTAGLAWFLWEKAVKAVPAALFSLGLALLSLLILVVVSYSVPNGYLVAESAVLVIGLALLVYAASLVALVRRGNIPALKAAACGLLGLVAFYFVGGFVLINAACSFGTGGC